MLTLYIASTSIFLFIWLAVGLTLLFTLEHTKDEFNQFAAVASTSFFSIIGWPVIIPVTLVSFLGYGLYHAIKGGYK